MLGSQLEELFENGYEVRPCEGMRAGVSPVFETSKAIPSSLCLPFVDQDECSWQLLQYHTCLLAATFSTMMVMDSNPLKL